MQVFVAEQGFSADGEIDEWDDRSLHAVAFEGQLQALATGRLKPDGYIGRMAVARAARGQGAGGAVLLALVALARARGVRTAWLSAQDHAIPFYAKHGFVPQGDWYPEEHVAHKLMSRALIP
jgi:predicted GNAT family N-acyltransferase